MSPDVTGKLQMSGTAHLILAASCRAEGSANTVHLCLLGTRPHARAATHSVGRWKTAPRVTPQHRLLSCVVDVAGFYAYVDTDHPSPANSSHKQHVTTTEWTVLMRPLRICRLTVFWLSKCQRFSQMKFYSRSLGWAAKQIAFPARAAPPLTDRAASRPSPGWLLDEFESQAWIYGLTGQL